jgi:hypothetical protein
MPVPPEKPPDEARIVALLAQESRWPVADVATLYAHERAQLALGAHITKFLHIFAKRKVQEILRERTSADPPGGSAEVLPTLASQAAPGGLSA